MREKIITRTVISLEVAVLGINSEDMSEKRVSNIPAMDTKKILPYLMNNSDDSFTPAKVLNVQQVEQLYGMPESVFMKYAEKLPPRKNYNIEKAEG